jgi:hypothetical protein
VAEKVISIYHAALLVLENTRSRKTRRRAFSKKGGGGVGKTIIKLDVGGPLADWEPSAFLQAVQEEMGASRSNGPLTWSDFAEQVNMPALEVDPDASSFGAALAKFVGFDPVKDAGKLARLKHLYLNSGPLKPEMVKAVQEISKRAGAELMIVTNMEALYYAKMRPVLEAAFPGVRIFASCVEGVRKPSDEFGLRMLKGDKPDDLVVIVEDSRENLRALIQSANKRGLLVAPFLFNPQRGVEEYARLKKILGA